ncbi:iron-containing alcohol dehydrogenase [Methanogenium organophilum]|uniref:Iron-containing alcohol dehydrogenase n=1 Tax=Methanogenium organophilum TaxID=2199 RepID=A0A9X9T8I0_METOG|nr:iron-containing alcohol dehydrogenase [Methanogenium organophilum]WAI01182.1 iron-containing alcohol dehydrogenase [Methanogenium organophilum]
MEIVREHRKYVIPEIITGDNSRIFAGRYTKNFHADNILIATDENLFCQNWMREILQSLDETGTEYVIFSEIEENPRDYNVMAGADTYLCEECTGILAIGGGSVLDCAKGIGIIAANGGTITDYIGVDLVRNPMPPLICVPTTAGSGADVSQYAVICNTKQKTKNLIISKSLVPDVSLIDTIPLMTQPDDVTIHSGIDTFTHALEAYVSNGSSHFSDMLAIESIKVTAGLFPFSRDDADNADYRFQSLMASMYAGISFSNAGLGLIHAMSHAIGAFFDLPHGLASSIAMRSVIQYNYSSSPRKYRKIADILGISAGISDDKEVVTAMVDKISWMSEMTDNVLMLSEYGATEDDIPYLVAHTAVDPCIATNPRIPDSDDLFHLFAGVL